LLVSASIRHRFKTRHLNGIVAMFGGKWRRSGDGANAAC